MPDDWELRYAIVMEETFENLAAFTSSLTYAEMDSARINDLPTQDNTRQE